MGFLQTSFRNSLKFWQTTGNALCSWERHAYFSLGQTVYPLWWPSLTKDLQTVPQKECSALVWLGTRGVPGSCGRTIKKLFSDTHVKIVTEF